MTFEEEIQKILKAIDLGIRCGDYTSISCGSNIDNEVFKEGLRAVENVRKLYSDKALN